MSKLFSLPVIIEPMDTYEPPEGSKNVALNEVFGPTIQGEGAEMGYTCFFIRTHGCPVQCPGCDTHYTWDGSETSNKVLDAILLQNLQENLEMYPGAGIVVSGGEPLLRAKDEAFRKVLYRLHNMPEKTQDPRAKWISLETSGYVAPSIKDHYLAAFLKAFTSVHISPKITPCLKGNVEYDVYLKSIHRLLNQKSRDTKIHFKFVAKDQDDFDAIDKFLGDLGPRVGWDSTFIMPYGIDPEDVKANTNACLEYSAKYGYIVSPRIHALIWGTERCK